MVTKSHLVDLGYQARETRDTPVHNCYEISKAFEKLCERNSIPSGHREVALGEKRITHHVATVPTKMIDDIRSDSGYTIIDATIDQFTVSNWNAGTTEIALGLEEHLPEVGIYPPTCEERKVWYHRK